MSTYHFCEPMAPYFAWMLSEPETLYFPSGSVLHVADGQIVGRTDPQPVARSTTPHDTFPDYIVTRGSDCDVFDIAPASKNALPANANLVKG